MQTEYTIKIIREYKGCQRLAKEILNKYITPLLLAYIY